MYAVIWVSSTAVSVLRLFVSHEPSLVIVQVDLPIDPRALYFYLRPRSFGEGCVRATIQQPLS